MLSAKNRQRIKEWGLLRALYAYLMVRYRHRFMLSWVMVRTKECDSPRTVLAPTRQVRAATLEELTAAAGDSRLDLNVDWARAALARGEICYAVFDGQRILSYSWRAFQKTPHEKGLEVRFDPSYVYGYYVYTHPLHRRQGLQDALDYYSDRDLLKRGARQGIGFVESYNYPSLIAHSKRGARKVGYAGYLTLFGRVFTFRSPGAKKCGFGFFHATPEGSAVEPEWQPASGSADSQ